MNSTKYPICILSFIALQGSLLPVPTNCMASMHRLLPELGADLFQGFMTEVQGALSKLQTQSSAVEDYVDKIEFLAKVGN